MKNIRQVLLMLFLCTSNNLYSQNKIKTAQFWFDGQIDNALPLSFATSSNIYIQQNIDVSALYHGLHTLHIRFADDSSRWSPASSHYFVKTEANQTMLLAELTEMEYWFNENISDKQLLHIGNKSTTKILDDIPVGGIKMGLNTLSFRVKDVNGQWSPVATRFFVKAHTLTNTSENSLHMLEYWLDFNKETTVQLILSESKNIHFVDQMHFSSLSPGLHALSLRFKDKQGNFNPALTRYFVMPYEFQQGSENALNLFEYWFDDKIAESKALDLGGKKIIHLIDSLDLNGLSNGLHRISYRFRDNNGSNSPVFSRFIFKQTEELKVANFISARKYWIDGEIIATVTNSDSIKNAILADSIDLRMYPTNYYTVGTQVRDANGQWSSMILDTILKLPYPHAVLSADKYNACEGDSVLFLAQTVDADSIYWDFEDAGLNDFLMAYHTFAIAGKFGVGLQVFHSGTGIYRFIPLKDSINIYSLPDLELGDAKQICAGDSLQISGPLGMNNYAWSTGSTSSGTFVKSAGWVKLEASAPNGCANADSLEVILLPLPTFSLGADKSACIGDSILISGPEGMEFYDWNGTSGTKDIFVDIPGLYILTISDANGCINSDSMDAKFHSLPELNLADTIKLQKGSAEMVDAGAGMQKYWWNNLEGNRYYEIGSTLESGIHSLILKVENEVGCSNADTAVIMIYSISNLNDKEDILINVFPNPVTDRLQIEGLSNKLAGNYSIYDALARPVKKGLVFGNNMFIDMQNLKAGLYILNLELNGKTITIPVMKK